MGVVEYDDGALPLLAQSRGLDIDTPYWNLVAQCHAPIIDRTGTLESPINLTITHPMPETLPKVDHISDLIDARAQALVDRGKPIIVYWSGGIDSTAALAALLKAGARDAGLTVRLTRYSPMEFREFYDELLAAQDGLTLEWCGAAAHTSVKREDLQEATVVTGEEGDQLMGSIVYRGYGAGAGELDCGHMWVGDEPVPRGIYLLFEEPWQDTFIGLFLGCSSSERSLGKAYLDNIDMARSVCDYVTPLMEKCPFEVRNAFDAWWWINFTCKWQSNIYRFVGHIDPTPAEIPNLAHFYDDIALQQWAMNEEKHRLWKFKSDRATNRDDPWAGWATYKFALKRYIHNFFPNDNYFRHKTKIGSLLLDRGMNERSGDPCFWFRLDDMTSVRTTAKSVEDFDRLHGRAFDRLFRP